MQYEPVRARRVAGWCYARSAVSMSSMYSSALAITSISAHGRSCDSVFDSASSDFVCAAEDERGGHHALEAAGFADDRGGLRALAGGRHHHHEVGAVDLLDQVLGAAGEIAAASRRSSRPALRRAAERRGGEERRAVPCALRQLLDHALARLVERDHLDRARLRVRRVDAEARLGGAATCGRISDSA